MADFNAPLTGRFYAPNDKDGEYRAFQVVDSPQSAAARQGFSDQLGVITATFHAALPSNRARGAVASGYGPSYNVPIHQYDDYVIGDLLAAINILYGEE